MPVAKIGGIVIKRKVILLNTKSEETFHVIRKQLEDLFQGKIEVQSGKHTGNRNDISLVLNTNQYDHADADFPDTIKEISAKRTIAAASIEPLLQIPRTSTCYVANNTYEASIETIELLKSFGLQLNMLPYPNDESNLDSEIKTVITHDRRLIRTDLFSEIYDIGFRPLDFSTIVEIALHLQVPINPQSYIQKSEQDIRRKIISRGFVSRYQFSHIIGESQTIKSTINKAAMLARADQSILISGENGTGKELFAHSIHHFSSRTSEPFVPINFAGLPDSLAESELFGYEDGAFTGAKKGGKPGFFEIAHNGTIFLDEIGDASESIQASLLRVLQEKQILRVGGTQLIPINVRVIAATNKNLLKLVEEGKFREDLFYRLNVLPLMLPPLRSRKEDIIPMTKFFFSKQGINTIEISNEAEELLLSYNWPGNVRELENIVYYLSAIMRNNTIEIQDLPDKLKLSNQTVASSTTGLNQLESEGSLHEFISILTYLERAKHNNWNTGRTSMELYFKEHGITPLSSQQIKHRMAALKKHNLVEIGSTRQGSWITQLGIDTLKSITSTLG